MLPQLSSPTPWPDHPGTVQYHQVLRSLIRRRSESSGRPPSLLKEGDAHIAYPSRSDTADRRKVVSATYERTMNAYEFPGDPRTAPGSVSLPQAGAAPARRRQVMQRSTSGCVSLSRFGTFCGPFRSLNHLDHDELTTLRLSRSQERLRCCPLPRGGGATHENARTIYSMDSFRWALIHLTPTPQCGDSLALVRN